MIIKQIYNNNIVLTTNEDGDEIVLVGKGIAFGLEKGDIIVQNNIEKRFELKGEAKYKFQQLIKDTPIDYIIASEEIISFIKEKYKKKLSDTIYVTLTDHIMNTVERMRMGIGFDQGLLGNIKQLYREEYEIGLEVVDLLNEKFDLHLDKSEANFIALHIIDAQLDTNMMQIYTITEIIDQIVTILNKTFTIQYEDNFAYDRFMTHCRFFVQRVLNNKREDTISELNSDMLTLMESKYPIQFGCVNKICDFLEVKYSYTVNRDEKLYLMIHLIKLTT